mmetsp:Transcript_708/g.756  ORF Transcript_708/g.756 Transcript_708/m.756 type:complete len:114 (-) Transcript_708:121-462(-)
MQCGGATKPTHNDTVASFNQRLIAGDHPNHWLNFCSTQSMPSELCPKYEISAPWLDVPSLLSLHYEIGSIQFSSFGASKETFSLVVASALDAARSFVSSVPQEMIKQGLVTRI